MGSTVSVIVRVRNSTRKDIISIHVFDIDGFDFGSRYRPDRVFNNVPIPAGTCVERMVELNLYASNCPFAMEMAFDDGSTDVFKINAKCAYDSTEPNLRHTKKTHCVYHKKPGPRILEVVVQHTSEQKEDQKAEELNSEAGILWASGRYEEASIKLLEAAQKANQQETKAAIKRNREKLDSAKGNDIDRRAEAVNSEGLQLLKENKYQQAANKFNEALKIAKNSQTISSIEENLKKAREAKDNQDAKMLNQEALLLRKNGQNERALMKFDEALKLASNASLIDSIKANKAETLHREALAELETAWLAETSLRDRSEEAIHKFAKARFLLEQADSIKASAECKKLVEIIDVKVEGNRLFSAGLELEREASRFLDRTVRSVAADDCKIAREKYEEALKHYEEADDKFQEGVRQDDGRFMLSLEMSRQAVNGIYKILDELEKAEEEIASEE